MAYFPYEWSKPFHKPQTPASLQKPTAYLSLHCTPFIPPPVCISLSVSLSLPVSLPVSLSVSLSLAPPPAPHESPGGEQEKQQLLHLSVTKKNKLVIGWLVNQSPARMTRDTWLTLAYHYMIGRVKKGGGFTRPLWLLATAPLVNVARYKVYTRGHFKP